MSLCPNLWVIVSTCITKWAQSHSGSLRKSEHGCDSHAGGSVHFSWQHFIKDRGLYAGHHTVHQTKLFLHPTDTRGKPRPCLIYDARHEKKKKKTSTAHCGRVWKVLTEQRGSFIDDKSCEVVLYTPFQTERDCVFFTQHVGEICCRVADRNLPWVCSTCFLFWNLLDLKAISVFVTFFFFWRVEVWHYLDLCKKKKVW